MIQINRIENRVVISVYFYLIESQKFLEDEQVYEFQDWEEKIKEFSNLKEYCVDLREQYLKQIK